MQIEVVRAPGPLPAALAAEVDALGRNSAFVRGPFVPPTMGHHFYCQLTISLQAQALSHEITSADLFVTPVAVKQHQTLMLARDDSHGVVGFLKTGIKHLFYVSPSGEYIEMDPICVLDFYVDEAWQRRGVGIQLFQHLLQEEGVTPAQLAYDRPSPKLFAFLKKHAHLTEHFPQPNRFVVFDAYFQPRQ